MPTMAEMLSPESLERLKAGPAVAEPAPKPGKRKAPKPPKADALRPGAPRHPRECTCERRHDGFTRVGDVLVHKACGNRMPEASILRGASAVPVTAPCAGGCGISVTVAVRKGVPEGPRVATCIDCAKAIATGQPITVLTRPRGYALGGITTSKETLVPHVNLDTLPSAQLGETIKEAERARLAADLPAKVKKAKKKRAKADKAQVKAKKRERRALLDVGVLDGFTLHGVEVPALDVSAVADLAEIPDRKVRSPYNKVRYREGLPLLPTQDEPGIGAETCTWATVVDEHRRMLALAGEQPKPKKAKKAQISAPVDLEERQIAAIVTAVGCSPKKARKILAGVR